MEINVGEETLYYRRSGSGKIFLLLHGNMSSGLFFQRTMSQVEGFDFIAPDMRGFGNSTYRKTSTDIKDYVEDIKQLILRLNLQNFHICGWSFGGGILLYLLQEKEIAARIDCAVFLSSMSCKGMVAYGKNSEYFTQFQLLKEMSRGESWKKSSLFSKELFYPFSSSLEQSFPWNSLFPERMKELFVEKIFLQYVYSGKKPPEKELYRNIKEAGKQRNFLEINQLISNFQIDPQMLPKKKYMVLHGTEDRTIDISVGKRLARELESTFYPYPHCGHSIFTDDFPKWKNFLSGLRD